MTDHKENSTRLVYGLPKITLHGVVANDSELKAVAQTQREQINWAEKLLGIPLVWTTTQGEGANNLWGRPLIIKKPDKRPVQE